jgi:hypothetical protein
MFGVYYMLHFIIAPSVIMEGLEKVIKSLKTKY